MSKSRHAYVRIRRSRACIFQDWLSPGGVVYARIRFESKMVMFGNTVDLFKHVITNNQLISRAYYCDIQYSLSPGGVTKIFDLYRQ